MTGYLYLAPAAAGKTQYALQRVREIARTPGVQPRVLVANPQQVRAWQRRLAEQGGALGVHVLTFDRLHAALLSAAGAPVTVISDPVQYRLVRAIVDGLPLRHYASLRDSPGFVQALQRLFGELQVSGIEPAAFDRAVAASGADARLADLVAAL